jgi:hypothetical protein
LLFGWGGVLGGVMLGGLRRVAAGVSSMLARKIGVMTRFLVVSAFVVFGGFPMMVRRVFVMFRRLKVLLCAWVSHFPFAFRLMSPDRSGT